MSAALVPADNVAALDTLGPADREQAVTQMLVQAQSWLTHAIEFTAPAQEISDFRAFIQTVADASRRTKVAKEIQLDAEVMVRRSERALGVAIRQGQEAGEIETTQEAHTRGGRIRQGVQLTGATGELKPKVGDFVNRLDELSGTGSSAGIYQMTDDVTDEQFEAAVTEAKEERNLSRANVVRKIKGDGKLGSKVAEDDPQRLKTILEMADTGHNSAQIAKAIGNSEEYVRRLAKGYDIQIPADKLTRAKRIDSNRVANQIVLNVTASVSGSDLVDFSALDGEHLAEWVTSLSESIGALSKFRNQLKKEMTDRG